MQTDLAYALLASGNNGGRRHEMNVAVPIGFNARQHPESPDGGAIAGALDSSSPQAQAVAFKDSHFTRGKDGSPRDTSPALSADADKGDQDPLVMAPYAFEPRIGRNGRGDHGDVTGPLMAESGQTGKGDAAPCVATAMAVRRFTPKECERLQGFEDGYTLVPYRTRRTQDFDEWFVYLKQSQPDLTEEQAMLLAADGPRYKSIGNSWAIPCVVWIGQRIEAVEVVLKFNRALGGLTSLEM